jgi:hypothetical protein
MEENRNGQKTQVRLRPFGVESDISMERRERSVNAFLEDSSVKVRI